MYQDPTEKSVQTKRDILQRTITLLGGEPYPLFWGKKWTTFFYSAKFPGGGAAPLGAMPSLSVPFGLWGLSGATAALSTQRKIPTHAVLIT